MTDSGKKLWFQLCVCFLSLGYNDYHSSSIIGFIVAFYLPMLFIRFITSPNDELISTPVSDNTPSSTKDNIENYNSVIYSEYYDFKHPTDSFREQV